jgi:predicted DNA-binding WGR domain protein
MIHMTRIDPDQNMSRFYTLHLQPSLFGGCDLIREWGRIGSTGTVRACAYTSLTAAKDAQAETVKRRQQRGYV